MCHWMHVIPKFSTLLIHDGPQTPSLISFPQTPYSEEPVVVEAEAYYEDLGQVQH